jgi:hypothetical protein
MASASNDILACWPQTAKADHRGNKPNQPRQAWAPINPYRAHVRLRRNEDSACFQMQENQDEQVAKASLRHDLLRVEVTLPHGFRMTFNELVSVARSAFRTDVVSVTLEDNLHSVASDRLDSELLQLAEDPRVSPRIVLRQLED